MRKNESCHDEAGKAFSVEMRQAIAIVSSILLRISHKPLDKQEMNGLIGNVISECDKGNYNHHRRMRDDNGFGSGENGTGRMPCEHQTGTGSCESDNQENHQADQFHAGNVRRGLRQQ